MINNNLNAYGFSVESPEIFERKEYLVERNEINNLHKQLAEEIINYIIEIKEYNNEIDTFFQRLLSYKSVLSTIFCLCDEYYLNSNINELIIQATASCNENEINKKLVLRKLSSIYCLNSCQSLNNIYPLFDKYIGFFIELSFALLKESYVCSKNATKNKNWLLSFLPKLINQLKFAPIAENSYESFLNWYSSAYMFCSYSSSIDKYQIKDSIHNIIKSSIKHDELIKKDNYFSNKKENLYYIKKINNKPIIFIINEHFKVHHSMYRCYSNLIINLKQYYYIIGISIRKNRYDPKAYSLFNESFILEEINFKEKLNRLLNLLNIYKPSCIFYPSIGMDPFVILLASFKLAPKQIYSHGHPGPVMSKSFDAALIFNSEKNQEKDPYIQYINCKNHTYFSTNDYESSIPEKWSLEENHKLITKDKKIKIAISSTSMKITEEFILLLKEIESQNNFMVEFNFFIANNRFTLKEQINLDLKKILKNSIIYNFMKYDIYLKNISKCHLFLSPTTFGNGTTLIDYLRVGLIGPCLINNKSIVQNAEKIRYEKAGLNFLIAKSKIDYVRMTNSIIGIYYGSNNDIIKKFIHFNRPSQAINRLCSATNDEMLEPCIKIDKLIYGQK